MPATKLVYRDDNQKPSFNIGVTMGHNETKGDVGIEIEVEGLHLLYKEDTPSPWDFHKDHSLRGEENAEYVLKAPIKFSGVPKALDTLFGKLKENSATFDDSNRTSVHVHLNCQEFHMNRLTVFLSAWYCVEEILTQFCGEHRIGNLFCLRAVDAPALVNQLRKFIRSGANAPLGDILHYGGLNPNALHKYGSLEIRTLRGPRSYEDQKFIQDWIDILQRVYDISAKYEDPRDFVSMFSGGGPLAFFDLVLGDMAPKVMATVGMHQNDISQSMLRGIRFAQDLCFCRDWDEFNPMRLRDDPFGRSKSSVAAKISTGPHTIGLGGFTEYTGSGPVSAGPINVADIYAQLNQQILEQEAQAHEEFSWQH